MRAMCRKWTSIPAASLACRLLDDICSNGHSFTGKIVRNSLTADFVKEVTNDEAQVAALVRETFLDANGSPITVSCRGDLKKILWKDLL